MAGERRKTMMGRVVSTKMAKTVVIEVTTRRAHPLYGKVVSRVRKFMADNQEPVLAKEGDLVRITESRPLSARKRWRVSEIIQRGEVVEPIRERELESLLEKEREEREARKQAEAQRASERLAELAGPGSEAEEEAEAEEGEDEEN